ncbi:MAG: hypothetical protein C5B43_01960 [Verrucomicrobia bacterium]|nr:MAG: hypothetical protein C5B43_01960 [Verrucomicrobiota bacterium]
MSHKITKHHQVRSERKHQNLETHREKKDQERLRLGNLLLHEGRFDQNRDALINSKKQNKFIQKVKADEKIEAKTGRVKK